MMKIQPDSTPPLLPRPQRKNPIFRPIREPRTLPCDSKDPPGPEHLTEDCRVDLFREVVLLKWPPDHNWNSEEETRTTYSPKARRWVEEITTPPHSTSHPFKRPRRLNFKYPLQKKMRKSNASLISHRNYLDPWSLISTRHATINPAWPGLWALLSDW